MTDDDGLKEAPTLTPLQHVKEANPFKALYEPIGALMVAFGEMEAHLTMTIDTLLSVPYDQGLALESLMLDFGRRIQLFHFLSQRETLGTEMRSMGAKIATGLYNVNEDRNSIVHGSWTGYNPNDDTYGKVRLKVERGKFISIPAHKISAASIYDEAAYCFMLSLFIGMWRTRYNWRDQTATRFSAWPAPLLNKSLPLPPLQTIFRALRKADKPPLR
jgi:hypothetical protein